MGTWAAGVHVYGDCDEEGKAQENKIYCDEAKKGREWAAVVTFPYIINSWRNWLRNNIKLLEFFITM